MFARRRRLSRLRRLRETLWPSIGLRRSARYMGHRMARLPDTSGSIAAGFAWGAAVSFTPSVGIHIALACLAAWATRTNVVAAALGTFVGEPWTFPFIWAATYKTGVLMLGGEGWSEAPLTALGGLFGDLWGLAGQALGLKEAGEVSWAEFAELGRQVLWPMAVGSVPWAIGVWLFCYLGGRRLLGLYARFRLERLRVRRERAGAPEGDVPNI